MSIKSKMCFRNKKWCLSMMELEFGGRSKKPDIRWLFDMKEVIYDKSWLAKAENIELYYMYRDLYLSNADKDKLIDQNLRYDITIIPPRMLGVEYVKTAGHYHPIPPGGTVSYPELYEVLEGEAIYLLQKQDMSDVAAVYAAAGDKVLVPPNYGHITINRSNKILKMANLVARDFSSIYDPIRSAEEALTSTPHKATLRMNAALRPLSFGGLRHRITVSLEGWEYLRERKYIP